MTLCCPANSIQSGYCILRMFRYGSRSCSKFEGGGLLLKGKNRGTVTLKRKSYSSVKEALCGLPLWVYLSLLLFNFLEEYWFKV